MFLRHDDVLPLSQGLFSESQTSLSALQVKASSKQLCQDVDMLGSGHRPHSVFNPEAGLKH